MHSAVPPFPRRQCLLSYVDDPHHARSLPYTILCLHKQAYFRSMAGSLYIICEQLKRGVCCGARPRRMLGRLPGPSTETSRPRPRVYAVYCCYMSRFSLLLPCSVATPAHLTLPRKHCDRICAFSPFFRLLFCCLVLSSLPPPAPLRPRCRVPRLRNLAARHLRVGQVRAVLAGPP